MATSATADTFDTVVLPHREAAYRLARWRMPGDDEVDDVVQEALLRSLRYFHTFAGENGRGWFLRIVRNTCRDWRSRGTTSRTEPFDEEQCVDDGAANPEALLIQSENATLIARAMDDLPGRHRELLSFRELEGLSYQEMADVMEIPMGTVMSGLSRARQAFRCALDSRLRGCAPPRWCTLGRARDTRRPARANVYGADQPSIGNLEGE